MKKLKMIVTSVVVLAIVGSAFAFNAKKLVRFCVTPDLTTTICNQTVFPSKRIPGTQNRYYVVDWDGASCNGVTCTTSARIVID